MQAPAAARCAAGSLTEPAAVKRRRPASPVRRSQGSARTSSAAPDVGVLRWIRGPPLDPGCLSGLLRPSQKGVQKITGLCFAKMD